MRRLVYVAMVACLAAPARAAVNYGPRQVAELTEIAAAEKEPESRRAHAIRELEHTKLRTHLSLLRRLLREERSLDIRLAAACTLAAQGDGKSPKDLLLVSAYDGSKTPNCSRSDILVALGRTRDPDALMHLERALQGDAPADEPFYYQDACRALVMLGTPAARKLLLTAIRSQNPAVRLASVSSVAAVAKDPAGADRTSARRLILLTARQDPDDKVAEQAASALLWEAVDGPGFFRLLEEDADPKARARAARVMNRQYLSPPRLERLRAALAKERDETVRAAMRATLDGQKAPQ